MTTDRIVLRQRLATALCACYAFLREAETQGRRRLFDAVNDAFVVLGR